MRFKTILITNAKRKLLITSSVIAVLVVLSVAVKSEKTEQVFNFDDTVDYVEILDSSLPSEAKKINLKDKLQMLLGFDINKPETIIADYNAALPDISNTYSDNTEEPQATEVADDTSENSTTSETVKAPEYNKPDYPSKSEIMSGVNLEMNNATSYKIDLKALCKKEPAFAVGTGDEPQVLIVHTHTTECFDGDEMNGETERTTDEAKNITAVGNVIADVLEGNGIRCVHDKTVHDYPSYQGAYTRTLSTIESNLKQYPGIKIVLDIHRDAYVYPDGSKLTVTCNENGISTAKVMLVVGTDSLGLYNPNWQNNLSFAAHIQSAANIMYPDMMRPIDLRRERFNMHVTNGSILMEVGSNGNTLDEAKEGGKNIANALSAVLLMQ